MVARAAVLGCVLTVIVSVVTVGGVSAQQSADSSASPQNPADSLNVIDHLIEQNQQLERQNRQLEQQNQQLIEQIKAVRGHETTDAQVGKIRRAQPKQLGSQSRRACIAVA